MATRVSRAAVIVGPHDVELREYPYPPITDDTGVLRVEAAGVCGVDYEVYEGIAAGTRIPYPMIPGHIIVGRIDAIGPEARRRWEVDEGDRVVIDNKVSCGVCRPCHIGERRHCVNKKWYGLWGFDFEQPPYLWGGVADHMALDPATQMVKVADDTDLARLCLQERLAAALSWVLDVGRLRALESVVVIGTGMLGLCAAIVSRMAGAYPCIVVARMGSRRIDMAKGIGADLVIQGSDDEVVEQVMAATRGRGADLVVELSDATALGATALGVRMLAQHGRLLQVATKNQNDLTGFTATDIIWKEASIIGAFAHEYEELEQAMHLLERGAPDGMDALSVAEFSLDEIERAMTTPAGSLGHALTVVYP